MYVRLMITKSDNEYSSGNYAKYVSVVVSPAAAETPCVHPVEHAPPIKLFGIHARYANATYSAASKAGKLDDVQRDLLAFEEVMKKNASFAAFLGNPTVSRGEKVGMVEHLFDAKSKTCDITKNLLMAMAGNARLDEAPKVIDAYTKMLKAKRGEIDAVVTTAEPLSPAQEKSLATALKTQVGAGKTVSLTTEVNPALVGGLTVQIGDKFLDLSIASKITSIKSIMNDAVANK
ncbi:unnamed protein product [Discosporangium mesarthrocarpum]